VSQIHKYARTSILCVKVVMESIEGRCEWVLLIKKINNYMEMERVVRISSSCH
jgi:hypothetical protein